MNINDEARAEYENISEAPGEVRDPLEEPFANRGRHVLNRDATVAEEDSRELAPEESADELRATDTNLTIEDNPR